MEDKMLELAAALDGSVQEQPELLRLLCGQALRELEGRLRPGVAAEDCREALALAGAWMALAGLYAGGEPAERFSAGDLTIQTGSGTARSAALRNQAERLMRPYVQDDGFAFRGVPG